MVKSIERRDRVLVKKQVWFLFFVLGLLCLFLSCLSIDYDYDLFARLIVGERFIEDGILPFKDFLSYTPTHPWFDHEWGSGVIFYLILKYFGAGGILFLQAFLMFCTVFFVFKIQQLQKHSYPPSLLFLTIFLLLFSHINPSLIRCQMFSFLFFSIFIYLLEKYRKQGSKLIWLIPVLTVIWNNLHGGIVSGLGIIFIYFITTAFEKKKQWITYFSVLSISFLLLIVNPYGINYLTFLFSAVTKNRKYIVEWWPFIAGRHVFYYMLPSIYCMYAMAATLFITAKNKKYDVIKLIIVSVTVLEGLIHVKLMSLALIATTSLCYNEISFAFLRLKKILYTLEKSLYAVIIIISLSIPIFSPQYPRANIHKLPFYEVEFLKINNLNGNIVVSFGHGSYVSYKLYPNNFIYMDGRYEEVYNDKEYFVLKDYELANDNWRDIVNKYDTEILMPLKSVDIYNVLQKDKDWVCIFEGKLCGIFVKKENLKNKYKEPEYNIDYYKKTMFDGYFGKKIRSKE